MKMFQSKGYFFQYNSRRKPKNKTKKLPSRLGL